MEGVRDRYREEERGEVRRVGRSVKRGREEERRREEERGRVFLVSIKQLSRLGIPKLWTLYFVHSAVVLCEISSA